MPNFQTSSEWYKSAEMDYFSGFLKMWLSTISAIKIINQDETLRKERQLIEYIKTQRNPIRTKYNRLSETIEEHKRNSRTILSDDADRLQTYLEFLVRKYDWWKFGWLKILKDDDIWLKPQMNSSVLDEISFKEFIYDIQSPPRKPAWYNSFWAIYVQEDLEQLFPYIIEILYMIRNLLVHWELSINTENKSIMEACYNILKILISDTVGNEHR